MEIDFLVKESTLRTISIVFKTLVTLNKCQWVRVQPFTRTIMYQEVCH